MGSPRKRVPKCLKGPKTTYTTIEIAEKQSKRSKKGPFSLYIGSPLVPHRKWNLWGPEGKVPPGPPGFSGHGFRENRGFPKHWRIQPSTAESNRRVGLVVGATWRRNPSQDAHKTENTTDLGHYFWEEPKSTFENKSELPPARGPLKSIEDVTEVDILIWKKNVGF